MGNNHYHPGKDWLVQRGYDPALHRAVQITHAKTLINEALEMIEQAMKRSSDSEGRLVSLKALIEERQNADSE